MQEPDGRGCREADGKRGGDRGPALHAPLEHEVGEPDPARGARGDDDEAELAQVRRFAPGDVELDHPPQPRRRGGDDADGGDDPLPVLAHGPAGEEEEQECHHRPAGEEPRLRLLEIGRIMLRSRRGCTLRHSAR